MTELDDDFRRVMVSLTLLSHGSTQSWNADRVSGGEKSRQPTGESDPPQQQLWRRWMECRSDDQRWAVLGEFADLLERWTKTQPAKELKPELPHQRKARIVAKGEGWTVAEVVRGLDMADLTVCEVREARSKAGRDPVRGFPLPTVGDDRTRVLALAERGCSLRQIADQTSVTKSTVDRWLKEAA